MSDKLIRSVDEVSWHRNGVGGAGFYAVLFRADVPATKNEEARIFAITARDKIEDARWLGILFDEPGHCAVICLDLLEKCRVRFGANSWRGDIFEPELRQAIEEIPSSGSVRVGPFGLPTS